MEKANCYNLIFSSSAGIYKYIDGKPISEESIINPCSPYAKTKYAVENLLNDIQVKKTNLWKIANLRFFNPIGAHNSGIIGENPKGMPNNILPLIIKVASKEIEELKVYGNDWPTKDKTCVRDYIHIEDIAEGHLKVYQWLLEIIRGVNVNLGTGIGTSILELIRTFEKVNEVSVPFVFDKRRVGDQPILIADNQLAYQLLNGNQKGILMKCVMMLALA